MTLKELSAFGIIITFVYLILIHAMQRIISETNPLIFINIRIYFLTLFPFFSVHPYLRTISIMLDNMHQELHGDDGGAGKTSIDVNGNRLVPAKVESTDELELSNEDVRVVTRASTSTENSVKVTLKSSRASTPKTPDTPKLRLAESPIGDEILSVLSDSLHVPLH